MAQFLLVTLRVKEWACVLCFATSKYVRAVVNTSYSYQTPRWVSEQPIVGTNIELAVTRENVSPRWVELDQVSICKVLRT